MSLLPEFEIQLNNFDDATQSYINDEDCSGGLKIIMVSIPISNNKKI